MASSRYPEMCFGSRVTPPFAQEPEPRPPLTQVGPEAQAQTDTRPWLTQGPSEAAVRNGVPLRLLARHSDGEMGGSLPPHLPGRDLSHPGLSWRHTQETPDAQTEMGGVRMTKHG